MSGHPYHEQKEMDMPNLQHMWSGHILEKVESAKYLRLNWNTHINHVVKKAFLQRDICQFPRKTNDVCYKALVRLKWYVLASYGTYMQRTTHTTLRMFNEGRLDLFLVITIELVV